MTTVSLASSSRRRVSPPTYFAEVKARAHARWDQLEADPDLAGPWQQLFRQVQSPRHVLSELLQNADDAGARSATARIDGDTFVFEHDGADFNADQFTSLCRFGFSNKRKLHTIGFRGIGFKSTFSLGGIVEVDTPTLAVQFTRKRFTEPVWMPNAPDTSLTRVRVHIEDAGRKKELQKNLEEWSNSLASLLFFQSIQKLNICGCGIERKVVGPGPVTNSEIVTLTGAGARMLIIVRSEEASFPAEALDEVRQERIGGDDDFSLPPCRVELVLGLDGEQRLYVILPTDVRPDLPFSINAPFVQDPARTGIKDPVISPTNRWLLKRLGNLAAQAMGQWLGASKLSMSDRAKAYDLLPEPGDGGDTIAGECESLVKSAFVEGAPDALLLTVDGQISSHECCIAPPADLYAIWTASELLQVFGGEGKTVLAAEVESSQRQRLARWNWLTTISREATLQRLENCGTIPKPDSWRSLVRLWAFVQAALPHDWQGTARRKLRLLPVEGGDCLVSSQVAVRLSANKAQLSDEDWQFISARLKVVEREWLSHLFPPQRRKEQETDTAWQAARELLQAIGLDSPTSPDVLVLRAYEDMMRQKTVPVEDHVRLVHIMAALDAQVPSGFQYVPLAGTTYARVEIGLVVDLDGTAELLLPGPYAQQHVIHQDYNSGFRSCSAQRWREWAPSPKSGLRTLVSLVQTEKRSWEYGNTEELLKTRGFDGYRRSPYSSSDYVLCDWDFDESVWKHWLELSKSDPSLWWSVVQRLAAQPQYFLGERSTATLMQVASRGRGAGNRATSAEGFRAHWVQKLRSLPCLQDTHGAFRQPAELLRRTPVTEPLLDIEPFVRAEFDTEATRPLLVKLGVRETPTGVDKIVDRLRALATVKNPPTHEVMKWYSRLDQMLPRCDSNDVAMARSAFAGERLILTEDGEWATSDAVFQNADEEGVPGAPVIHASARHLTLWTRLGVADRPTVDLLVAWIKALESGRRLDASDLKRVRAALQRCPNRVWEECGHWLSLDGTWVPTDQLEFGLTMQGLTKWGELFPAIKARTANLQMLSAGVCEQPPFSSLKGLGGAIEHRLTEKPSNLPPSQRKAWIAALGAAIRRVKLSDDVTTAQVRAVGARLEATVWQPFDTLRVTPYIGATPAGQPYSPVVLWHEQTLYVRSGKLVKLYNAIVDELARPVGVLQIAEAIRTCIERDEQFVVEYMADNFELITEDAVAAGDTESKPADGEPDAPAVTEGDQAPGEADDDTGTHEPQAEGASHGEAEGQTDDGHDDTGDEEKEPQKPRPKRPHEPTLIEQYALLKGFHWDAAHDRYVHSDGSWLQKCEGSFNWARHAPSGEVKAHYWVSEQCLLNGGIEIAAECWELVRRDPVTRGLIVQSEDRRPLELTGVELVRMEAGGAITLYPARYRLRKSGGD